MRRFLATRGATICPPSSAAGSGFFRPTAGGRQSATHFENEPARVDENDSVLAKAKIMTMLELVGRKGKEAATPKYREVLREQAYHWFFSRSSDFELWCEDAGMEPEHVRRKAREIYDNGWPEWRAKPGQGTRYLERRKQTLQEKALRANSRSGSGPE